MAEEFQESEFFFTENATTGNETHQGHHRQWCNYRHSNSGESQSKKKSKSINRNSAPVSVPDNLWTTSHQYVETDEETDSDDGEIVPPHVIVGRRLARTMEFSVCSGNGRTLKGRDLSQVRNSILRMTGFLEA